MCYSVESSLRTSGMSAAAIAYLFSSGIPKYKWLAVTLIGWCSMQLAEAMLWLTNPRTSCTQANRVITLTLIPLILVMQGLGALYGSFYVTPWRELSRGRKLFFVGYTVLITASILVSQFGTLQSACTTVTPMGHLNWSTNKTGGGVLAWLTNTQSVWYTVVVLAIPLAVLWPNKWELLYLFAVPFAAVLYGLSTDAAGSVWCYYTSFASIAFALMLFVHQTWGGERVGKSVGST